MSSEGQVTYYALLDSKGNPGGLLRRTRGGPVPIDETFRRDLTWQPSEFLRKYYLGHNDMDYREISSEEAASLIEKWTKKWAGE
jgi:hypothetical protein